MTMHVPYPCIPSQTNKVLGIGGTALKLTTEIKYDAHLNKYLYIKWNLIASNSIESKD